MGAGLDHSMCKTAMYFIFYVLLVLFIDLSSKLILDADRFNHFKTICWSDGSEMVLFGRLNIQKRKKQSLQLNNTFARLSNPMCKKRMVFYS